MNDTAYGFLFPPIASSCLRWNYIQTWWQTWHTLTKVYARSDQNWFCGKKPKYFTAGVGLHGHCADSMVKFKLASLVKPRGAFCNVCRGGRSPLWSTPKLDARENPHKGVQSFYYCFIFCFSQEPGRLHVVLIYSVVWEILEKWSTLNDYCNMLHDRPTI